MTAEERSDGVDVTVLVVTYDHESSIERALASVVAQRTSRSLEILISEDCSTDATRDLVRAFAAREPRARLLLSPRNLRSNEVVARGIRAARGRYLCLLDGDDHWTSPSKIETQADLLDRHPHVAAWFHNAAVWRSDRPTEDRWTPSDQPRVVDADGIWDGNPFATCAGMLRIAALADVGPWYDGFFPMTDWPLYVACAQHGELRFDDEVVGAYRLHDGGLVSSLPGRAKLDMIAGFYRRMDAALGHRAHERACAAASRFFFEWAEVYAARGDRRMARSCLARSVRAGGVARSIGRRAWLQRAWRLV